MNNIRKTKSLKQNFEWIINTYKMCYTLIKNTYTWFSLNTRPLSDIIPFPIQLKRYFSSELSPKSL